MIQALPTAITFTGDEGETTIHLQQSLVKYEANDPNGVVELLLWTLISSVKAQTKLIEQSMKRAADSQPDVGDLMIKAMKQMPDLVAALGAGGPDLRKAVDDLVRRNSPTEEASP